MKTIKYTILLLAVTIFTLSGNRLNAQDDLMNLLGNDDEITNYEYATFKTTRLVIGQSIENPASGTLLFLIQHHFGKINSGSYDFWGLDQAFIRLGFEYGINNRIAVGVGRSSEGKIFDGFLKAKILRQSTGKVNMPVSLSYFGSVALTTIKWAEPERENYFSSRLAYTHQLLLARKFSPAFSLQITPTLVHKNMVETKEDMNDIFAIGIGGRIKLTNRISLNMELFSTPENYKNYESKSLEEIFKDSEVLKYLESYISPISIGFDIETGGHVFQLFFTNSSPLIESGFIPETQGSWANGDIYFGFNISRVFTIVKPKSFQE